MWVLCGSSTSLYKPPPEIYKRRLCKGRAYHINPRFYTHHKAWCVRALTTERLVEEGKTILRAAGNHHHGAPRNAPSPPRPMMGILKCHPWQTMIRLHLRSVPLSVKLWLSQRHYKLLLVLARTKHRFQPLLRRKIIFYLDKRFLPILVW